MAEDLIKDVIAQIANLEIAGQSELFSSENYASASNLPHQAVVGVLKSLESREAVELLSAEKSGWVLTSEGEKWVKDGSPEVQVFNAIPADGIGMKELMESLPIAKFGWPVCKKEKWLGMDKGRIVKIKEEVDGDQTRDHLVAVKSGTELPAKLMAALKKRKMVSQTKLITYTARKGTKFAEAQSTKKLETDLTSDMLAKDTWSQSSFKAYNFKALGQAQNGGHLHPLLKVRDELRRVFLQMGFQEMPTNNWVESSFWNFDTLFQPQQHPARDMHDTFFMSAPAAAGEIEPEYQARVHEMHEKGGHGSIGWRYNWKESEAKKNILRTHTTAVSARVLYKLAQEYKKTGVFKPVKLFSIDRVFRNETLDATHLAEFQQIEGVVADRDLSLADLIGVIGKFFELAFGMKQMRYKPAYNPYTEPSMEIFAWMPELNKWSEVGNSGIFRYLPEMLRPMGLPEDVRCLAWGLSVERPTMIKYKLKNIRDLVGHKMNLGTIEDNPICQLKELE